MSLIDRSSLTDEQAKELEVLQLAEADRVRLARAEANQKEFESRLVLAQVKADRLDPARFGIVARAAAQQIAVDVLTGKIQVRNGTEAANLMKALSDVAERELRQSPSELPLEDEIAQLTKFERELENRRVLAIERERIRLEGPAEWVAEAEPDEDADEGPADGG